MEKDEKLRDTLIVLQNPPNSTDFGALSVIMAMNREICKTLRLTAKGPKNDPEQIQKLFKFIGVR